MWYYAMDNLISMLRHDGPILGLILTVIKDKIVVKWLDLRGALIFICNNESLLIVLTFFGGFFFLELLPYLLGAICPIAPCGILNVHCIVKFNLHVRHIDRTYM